MIIMHCCYVDLSELLLFFQREHNINLSLYKLFFQIDLVDMECNAVLEIILHMLSVIIIQTQSIPAE